MVLQTAEPLNVFNAVIFQVFIFYALRNWNHADELFVAVGLVSVAVGYVAHLLLAPRTNFIQDLKTFAFLISSIAFLTPLLQSLTVAYSNDSIMLLALALGLIHICAYDFQDQKTYLKSTQSLNAIFFAAILLASRLSAIASVFVLLSNNLLIFGFGP